MLNPADAEKLTQACRDLGFEHVEIYVENTQVSKVTYHAKADSIQHSARQGISVTAKRDGISYHFCCDGFGIEPLLRALKKENNQVELSSASNPSAPSPSWRELGETASGLLQAVRGAFSSSSEALSFQLASATLTDRRYKIFLLDGNSFEGSEQTAEFQADWKVNSAPFHWERARGSLAGLVSEVSSPLGLGRAVRHSLSAATRWPAPAGDLAVLWSPRSVAKLQMLFLRAFEGDRVLDQRSFLNAAPLPFALAFSLEDRPSGSDVESDHEGSARKRTTFIRAGRPTALACNKELAAQLSVPSTGHARRESFDAPTTIGFWHLYVEGNQQQEALLPQMQQGISVREFEVLSYNPATADVHLNLTEAYLVHQGAEGELMEPLQLEIPLTELLESLQEFEQNPVTTGVTTGKERQKIFTEITAPAALSRKLQLRGSVPANHYW